MRTFCFLITDSYHRRARFLELALVKENPVRVLLT